jgi:hypothetical protein
MCQVQVLIISSSHVISKYRAFTQISGYLESILDFVSNLRLPTWKAHLLDKISIDHQMEKLLEELDRDDFHFESCLLTLFGSK